MKGLTDVKARVIDGIYSIIFISPGLYTHRQKLGGVIYQWGFWRVIFVGLVVDEAHCIKNGM